MSNATSRWVALVVGVAGFAIGELVWAPAGVALTFVALFLGFQGVGKLNVPIMRVIFVAVGVLHGLSIARASGSWLLGVGPAFASCTIAPHEVTTRRFGYKSMWFVIGAFLVQLASMGAAWPPTWWHLAALPTLMGLGFFSVQLLSAMRRMSSLGRAKKLAVGDTLADFTLPARLGRGDVTLSSFRGRYVLLCLLRGDWCPVCQVIMRIVARDAKALAERGVQVIAVGVLGGDEADETARFLGLDYLFVVDEQCTIAAQLGTVHETTMAPGQRTNLPAMILVDPGGKIAWISTAADLTVADPSHALRYVGPTPATAS